MVLLCTILGLNQPINNGYNLLIKMEVHRTRKDVVVGILRVALGIQKLELKIVILTGVLSHLELINMSWRINIKLGKNVHLAQIATLNII